VDIDVMWPNGPQFLRTDRAFPIGTDAVLLSAFVDASRAHQMLDLGCGSGVIALLLAFANQTLSADGLELDSGAAQVATTNAVLCGLSDRVHITCGDLRDYRNLFTAGYYDLVVTNPPYYPVGSGRLAEETHTATARGETSCTLADICAAAAYFTRWGGKFALVHKPERLAQIICILSASGLEPKRLRFVQHRPDSAPNLVLIESRRGGKPGLTVEAPLIMTTPDGSDSPEIKRIYHRR
jgi:tRNA1Val (adenine37-N6)-methyltransferase